MAVEMRTTKIPEDGNAIAVRHAREMDALRQQCNICKLKKPNTPTKDCAVRIKLIVEDSKVAWKHRHLFFHSGPGNHCKMFQEK